MCVGAAQSQMRAQRTQKGGSRLTVEHGGEQAYLVEVVEGQDPASRAVVRVLQAHELTDWVVGAPVAPGKHPLQLSQVQYAVWQVWERVGEHPSELQVGEERGSGRPGDPAVPPGRRDGCLE